MCSSISSLVAALVSSKLITKNKIILNHKSSSLKIKNGVDNKMPVNLCLVKNRTNDRRNTVGQDATELSQSDGSGGTPTRKLASPRFPLKKAHGIIIKNELCGKHKVYNTCTNLIIFTGEHHFFDFWRVNAVTRSNKLR